MKWRRVVALFICKLRFCRLQQVSFEGPILCRILELCDFVVFAFFIIFLLIARSQQHMHRRNGKHVRTVFLVFLVPSVPLRVQFWGISGEQRFAAVSQRLAKHHFQCSEIKISVFTDRITRITFFALRVKTWWLSQFGANLLYYLVL